MKKKVDLGNPEAVARKEAEHLSRARQELLSGPIDRVLRESPFVKREALLAGIQAFHTERMERIPDATQYPESLPWIQHIQAVDAALQTLAGLSDLELAIYRSFHDFIRFRGYRQAAVFPPVMQEKCRVVYLPETDCGTVHAKNVDDPPTFWQPQGPEQAGPNPGLCLDGTGSGLHIDDEPNELFPLPVRRMVPFYTDETPGALQFLERYSSFWGGANLVVFDRQKRSAAVEKCSYNYFEVFMPDACGGSHCSGMVCRNPHSPQGVYQRQKREDFLRLYKRSLTDGAEIQFWEACQQAERMLADFMNQSSVHLADLEQLLTTRWPEGLNKENICFDGGKVGEYTLITRVALIEKNKIRRWQRSTDLVYPITPECFSFTREG